MAKDKKPFSDPRGGHVRLYWEILDSNAWRCLSACDQRAYIALHRSLRSTNNGDLSLPISVARQHGIKSQTTLAKSLRALCAVGLLAVARKGGSTKGGQRMPTLYRFTDHPAYANPAKHLEAFKATNEWKAITTLGLGRQAMRDAEEAAATLEAEKKTKVQVQKMEPTCSKNGVVEASTSPKSGAWIGEPPQILESVKTGRTAAKPMLARVPA